MSSKCFARPMSLALLALLLLVVLLLLHNRQQAARLELLTDHWQLVSTALEAPQQLEVQPRAVLLQQLLSCRNRTLELTRLQLGEYWLLRNLIVGKKSRRMGCAESISYTTNGDYTFFGNLEPVAQRWRGPISFAIYAPGHDLNLTMDAIQYVRNCLPGSALIADYVSFHLYFLNNHMPQHVPHSEAEALNWPYSCINADGSLAEPPYAKLPPSAMYRTQHNLTYPINVGRNIARQAANTHFIFACDIELYPSAGFIEQFLDMVQRNHSLLALNPRQPRRVYPLPVFELEPNVQVPTRKSELLALLQQQSAQLFHAKICKSCHKVPGQQQWLERNISAGNELQVLTVGKRLKQFASWEPFYVSDNTEPLFDTRVSWEGQSNKRIQGYAMCLLDYEYHVLHPAFLVHNPQPKTPTTLPKQRLQYAREMTQFIKSKIVPEYLVLYGNNSKCRV